MKSQLKSDILILIIEKLYDDKKSLHTCLFVNKEWCKISVQFLWKDPWSLFLNENSHKKAKLFFNTVLSQLPKESINNLKARSIILPQRFKPPFDYVSNCKYLRSTYSTDGKKDNDIYENVFSSDYNELQQTELKKEIHKLFISKCSGLKFIDLINVNFPLYEFPGVERSLSELSELCCDDKSKQLLNGLSKKCKSIEKFDVNLTCSNSGFADLISIQQKVKSLIIKDNVNESNLEKQYENVGNAIIRHARSLSYLNLTVENNVSFYNNLLSALTQIQKLVLYDSRYRNVAVHKQLKFSPYPKLQVLQIGISFSVAVKIIQETQGSIKMIWLDKGNQESEEQIGQLIKVISQHCQNLRYLKIYLKHENLEDFEQLLINCKFLEGLYIYRGNIYNDDDGKGLLDILVRSAQNNLCKFQLHYCYFKINTLDKFIKNWKGKNRKPLWLYPILANYYEDRPLSKQAFIKNKGRFNDMIEKYKKEGIIKMFDNYSQFMFINFPEFNY